MPKRKTKYTMRKDGIIVLTATIEGKRKYFYGSSDAEVERKLAAYKQRLAEHPCRTLSEVADAWWEHKYDEISPNTVHGYMTAKNRAVEQFGSRLVKDITPQEIIAWLQKFAAQGFSSKVISNTKSVLHCILDEAFAAGEIVSNPCSNLPVVKGKAKAPRQAAAERDIGIIEQHKTDSLAGRMFYLMLYTGLRRGEACALQWKHIDAARGVITVQQALAYETDSVPIIKSPKTAAGYRTVPLLQNVAAVLPERGKPDAFVFFPEGLPRRRAYDRFVDQFREDNGIQSTCHQLRHSYSSLLFDAGLQPKEMQSLLGHANISVTMDIYTHLQRQHQSSIADKLNAYVVGTVVGTAEKP